MSHQSKLLCYIIPIEAGNLLVPEHLVAEIVPLVGTDSEHKLVWRGRVVPIFQDSNKSKLATRVAIIRTVMNYTGLPFIAIVMDGISHSLAVTPDLLSKSSKEDVKECSFAASYGTVGSLDCIIPDLPRVERIVQEMLSVTV